MRVLVVDDSAFIRRVITRLIESDKDLTIVATGTNGREAIQLIREHQPDVVTLDIQMPEMDGLSTLRELKRVMPVHAPPVLMCSSLTSEGSHEALEALRLGAADFILKDAVKAAGAEAGFRDELIAKIKAIGHHRRAHRPQTSATTAAPPRPAGLTPELTEVARGPWKGLLIGSSTGGPPVLERIITAIPAGCPIPIVVAQHMPELFTRSLAERLDRAANLKVQVAEDRVPLEPGHVYVGLGGTHVRVVSRAGALRLDVSGLPADAPYKPSVDELFKSGAVALGRGCLAMVLTGMGADGALGATKIAAAGGCVIAQEASTCVVYGMPKAVVDNQSARLTGSPEQLSALAARLGRADQAPPIPGTTQKRCA